MKYMIEVERQIADMSGDKGKFETELSFLKSVLENGWVSHEGDSVSKETIFRCPSINLEEGTVEFPEGKRIISKLSEGVYQVITKVGEDSHVQFIDTRNLKGNEIKQNSMLRGLEDFYRMMDGIKEEREKHYGRKIRDLSLGLGEVEVRLPYEKEEKPIYEDNKITEMIEFLKNKGYKIEK